MTNFSDKEVEKFLRENYTFNLDSYEHFEVENGVINIYFCERGNESITSSYTDWQEFVKKHGNLKAPKKTIDSLEELDGILKEKNEGYRRAFPVSYKVENGVYTLTYDDARFEGERFVKEFISCNLLSEYILDIISETSVVCTASLAEIIEAEKELDYCNVNYKSEKYYDRKLERNVYTIFTWNEEIKKIKDYNWFHDSYCHPVR